MVNKVKIKKGLDIKLAGKAPEESLALPGNCESYGVVPDDYPGLVPKLSVRVGDKVEAGSPVLFHKNFPEIKIVSPVSGEVVAVHRGEKRKILSVEIKADATISYKQFDTAKVKCDKSNREAVKALMLESGMWSCIHQRPYDIIAASDVIPRDIFITGIQSQPLAPELSIILKEEEKNIQAGIDALEALTDGKVYLSARANELTSLQKVERVEISGPHPAGLVGTLINKVAPVNKNETVWTLKITDVAQIGKFFLSGKVDLVRKIVLAGSDAKGPGYYEIRQGAKVFSVFQNNLTKKDAHERVIAGDVLTGKKLVAEDDYFPPSCDMITVIPEGDDVHDFFGWIRPGFDKYSVHHSYFSWLMPWKKEYVLDARIKGGERAIIVSNEYDKVFPMDIYPEYLLKAIITFDITKMENLGIYEVAPEDFSLCEFVDTSKLELQRIVRQGLDMLYKEMN